MSDNWKSLVASAVAIAVTAVTVGTASGATVPLWLAVVGGAAGGAAGGMTGALLNGANFGQIMKAGAVGGFWGAVSSAVSFGVGKLEFDNIVGKMLAHGISQGALEAAQGGKFQHGFFSAAFTAGLGDDIKGMSKTGFGRVLASSVVGGTASVLGGGKFANGAITGAYVMMFNCMQHPDNPETTSSSTPTEDGMSALDWAQTGLDVAGLVPVFGEIADGLNALIYLARGDYLNAGLSAAAMVPFAGWAATGGKLGVKGAKAAKVGKMGFNTKVNKMVDDVAKINKIDRKGFGEYIHKQKAIEGRGGADNYTWKELEQMANKYKKK